jgi:hypothetical protein
MAEQPEFHPKSLPRSTDRDSKTILLLLLLLLLLQATHGKTSRVLFQIASQKSSP